MNPETSVSIENTFAAQTSPCRSEQRFGLYQQIVQAQGEQLGVVPMLDGKIAGRQRGVGGKPQSMIAEELDPRIRPWSRDLDPAIKGGASGPCFRKGYLLQRGALPAGVFARRRFEVGTGSEFLNEQVMRFEIDVGNANDIGCAEMSRHLRFDLEVGIGAGIVSGNHRRAIANVDAIDLDNHLGDGYRTHADRLPHHRVDVIRLVQIVRSYTQAASHIVTSS